MSNLPYSFEFETAWQAYMAGLTPQEKGRSGKVVSFQRWQKLALDKHLDAVLSRIKELDAVYSAGFRPGFQKWIKDTEFSHDEAVESSLSDDNSSHTTGPDWGKISVEAKAEARKRKLHKRLRYFHNPESIYWAISSIAKGEEKGPATVERVLELAVMRAERVTN